MKPPAIAGKIGRRILVNFSLDPEVAARLLPKPFRPNLQFGRAVVGICLIRMEDLRPKGLPRQLGVTSENAAHRFAVEWDDEHGRQHGVYVPRRDSSSLLSTLVGGRLFPGIHHRAVFTVNEIGDTVDVSLVSKDKETSVSVRGHVVDELPVGSIFGDLNSASEFFRNDPVGFSKTGNPDCFDGLELKSANWELRPLEVEHVASSFFSDPNKVPDGSIKFDSALLMTPTDVVWQPKPQLRL